MNFRIADTFTTSLARLTGDEQKAVKTTAFDLQLNPAHPGFSFHKLDQARDRNFWSVRVSRDLRLIVHRSADNLLLAYVDHHDAAYRWAEKRRLETHPTTGAAQWVQTLERVEPEPAAARPATAAPQPPLARTADDALLGWGVPPAWLADVKAADEDRLLEIAAQLPGEAAEAVLTLATGGTPEARPVAGRGGDPFDHPDAQRRFRTIDGQVELQQALDWPWDRWTVFLHPAQRQSIERAQSGPARVSGSAGTGKTVVALHRAVHLARRRPDARVLLTTLSAPLAAALHALLRRLVGSTPMLAERIDVVALDNLGDRLYRFAFGTPQLATDQQVAELLRDAAHRHGAALAPALRSPAFLLSEWSDVVDAWQIDSAQGYRDIKRLGRKTRLSDKQRAALWDVFAGVRDGLRQRGLTTRTGLFRALADHYRSGAARPPFDHVVVDEAQDVSVGQLAFLAAFAGDRPDGLFFAGDTGQRIFCAAFSWAALGVDVRGRSRTLKVNYRTSHQIRARADRLLGPAVTDGDGVVEERRGTVSVFNGPVPRVRLFDTPAQEMAACAEWLRGCTANGLAAHEIGLFVRSDEEAGRATAVCAAAGLPASVMDSRVDTETGAVSIGTMHLAKGLEFRAVAVIACDEDVLPSQARLANAGDEGELREMHETERHLLYVACTRARDRLWVSGVAPGSEFLADLGAVDR